MNREISRRNFIRTSVIFTAGLFLPVNILTGDCKRVEAETLSPNFDFSTDKISGHFYTETRGGAQYPLGFAIYDDKDAQFWSKFRELGGVDLLGYPVSNRFQIDGLFYQATQNFLLQSHPKLGTVFANTLDLLNQNRLDSNLYNFGVPLHIADDGSGGNFELSKEIHRSWLTDPDIAKFYKTNTNFEEIYGFATSKPEKRGPFIAQRFQRSVIIKWVEQVANGQPKGTVQFANIGDLCKNIGLFPANSITPSSLPQGAKIEENKYILPQVFRSGNPNAMQSHITFDDGLSGYKSYLEQILNIAKEKEQKLTFFLIGSEMKRYPELVRRIWKEGHGLENHTLDHPFLSKLTDTEIRKQITEQKKIAQAIINDPLYKQKFLRPPYGDGIFNYDDRIPVIAAQEGLKIAMWSMDFGPDVAKSVAAASKGSIMLQHIKPADFPIVTELFDGVRKKGIPSVPLEIYN